MLTAHAPRGRQGGGRRRAVGRHDGRCAVELTRADPGLPTCRTLPMSTRSVTAHPVLPPSHGCPILPRDAPPLRRPPMSHVWRSNEHFTCTRAAALQRRLGAQRPPQCRTAPRSSVERALIQCGAATRDPPLQLRPSPAAGLQRPPMSRMTAAPSPDALPCPPLPHPPMSTAERDGSG